MSNPLTPPGSKLHFVDVTGEISRTYIYPGYDEITIVGATQFAEAKDKSHRVLDENGVAHHIPPSWIDLLWIVEDGVPIFRW